QRDAERIPRRRHRLPSEWYALDEHDCAYFFTLCARHRGEAFRDPGLAQDVIDSLLWCHRRHEWSLFAYCLMPDHLHFVAALRRVAEDMKDAGARGLVVPGILEQVAGLKSYTNRCWWRRGNSGLLWQRGSFDRIVRRCEALEGTVAYILDNPVRKGL